MIFLRPWYLLLLLILPMFVVFINKSGLLNSAWSKIVDKELLEFLSIKTHKKTSKTKWWFVIASLLSLIIAISGPSWHKTEITNFSQQKAIMLALDLSTDTSKEDLERFKFYIQDIINETNNTSMGLIVYTNEPYLISPITQDKNVIASLLPQIDHSIMPSNGNNASLAQSYGKQKLKDAGFDGSDVVLLSNNSKVDIPSIIQKLNTQQSKLKESSNKIEDWQDMGYYFLFLPAVVCLYFFRKGLFVFLLLFSFSAQANIFLNNNQQGLKAFNAGDYKTAQQKFNNKDWQASSYYKSGDYKKALSLFSDPYNQGNAMAKSGDIEGAIKKYEEVLKNNPNHADAKFNLEYLKQQQNQQQQQQNQDNQDNQKEQDKDNQEKQNQDNQEGQDNKEAQDNKEGQDNQDKKSQEQDQNSQEQDQQQENSQNQEQNQNKENQNNSQTNSPEQSMGSSGNEEAEEKKAQEKAAAKEGEGPQNDKAYTEQAQAREQQFREIPEDAGGLLRAFIYKEHQLRQRGY